MNKTIFLKGKIKGICAFLKREMNAFGDCKVSEYIDNRMHELRAIAKIKGLEPNKQEVTDMAKTRCPMTRLAQVRQEKGFTQQALSKECGWDAETISRYERGVRIPNVLVLQKIAGVLGCSISDIVGD